MSSTDIWLMKTEIHALGNLDIVLEYSVKIIVVILSALGAQDEKMDNFFDLPLHCHRQFADKSISCCLNGGFCSENDKTYTEPLFSSLL